MNYVELFRLLYENKIRYVICGGLALNLYGIPRMTVDIDLVLDLTDENISAFQKCLEKLKYKPILPIDLKIMSDIKIRKNYKEKKNLIAFSYYNHLKNFMQLDVLLDIPLPFEEIWEHRISRKTNEFYIYLTSVEHLITMKEYSDRLQDRSDIILLTKYKKRKFLG